MVTKGNIHNTTNWPQSVSTSSCAIRKGFKSTECNTGCIYRTCVATTWRSDCLTEVKVIKSNSMGPRKRWLQGAGEEWLNLGLLNMSGLINSIYQTTNLILQKPSAGACNLWVLGLLWIHAQTPLLLKCHIMFLGFADMQSRICKTARKSFSPKQKNSEVYWNHPQ